jgi:serine/threonine protein kinase
MLTRRRPSPYDINDPRTLEIKQQQQFQTSHSFISKQKVIDPPSKFNPKVTNELDNCILKMINVDPKKRHSSVWDLITDFDMLK